METNFDPFDWQRLLLGLQPPLYYAEVALKIVFVFLLLLLVMRLLGKRGQNNLSPMQQMLLIALGSAAGDALLYPNVALGLAAAILIGVTVTVIAVEYLGDRSHPVMDLVESHPMVLVRDGVIDERALRSERTNIRELRAALREAGARSLAQVELAILEVTGNVSVFLNDSRPTRDDLLEEFDEPRDAAAGHGRSARA